jgi:hypothetical protein
MVGSVLALAVSRSDGPCRQLLANRSSQNAAPQEQRAFGELVAAGLGRSGGWLHAGRCQLDILVVAQLNRGAYGSSGGPDVSHLAGTSELERYASAVWLIERPRNPDGSPTSGARDVLEVHHGKFRHGQMDGSDLSRTVIHLDRGHCFLEADEARLAFCGADLYPGVAVP